MKLGLVKELGCGHFYHVSFWNSMLRSNNFVMNLAFGEVHLVVEN